MSVDSFRFQNFMALKDTGWFDLRRLNLLIGPNSSGKSAIFRALRLLKQSLDGTAALNFTTERGLDVGTFDSVLHKPADERNSVGEILFSFQGRINAKSLASGKQDVQWGILRRCFRENRQSESLAFEVTLAYGNEGINESQLHEIRLQLLPENHEQGPITIFDSVLDSSAVRHRIVHWFPEEDERKMFFCRTEQGFLPELGVTRKISDSPAWRQEQADAICLFWLACKTEIARFLDRLQHVGPIRPEPERYYILTDEEFRKWERLGWKFYMDFIRGQRRDIHDRIDLWVKRMGLGDSISPIRYSTAGGVAPEIAELMLYQDQGKEVNGKRNLRDVGYGASQIVPVIVASFSSENEAVLLLEQPELHLHPKAQAEIADLFVDAILNSFRYIIAETHSEHILRRTQVLVAQGKIDPQAISVILTYPDGQNGAKIEAVSVLPNGQLKRDLPSGFLDKSATLIRELINANV